MATEIPQLNMMLNNHSFDEIETAQALIRKIVIFKTSELEKNQIRLQCRMKKFEEFYSYFLNFREELGRNELSKRLKK